MCSRSSTPHHRQPLGAGKRRSESLPILDIIASLHCLRFFPTGLTSAFRHPHADQPAGAGESPWPGSPHSACGGFPVSPGYHTADGGDGYYGAGQVPPGCPGPAGSVPASRKSSADRSKTWCRSSRYALSRPVRTPGGTTWTEAFLDELIERRGLVYRDRQVRISRWVMCASSWTRPVSTSHRWTATVTSPAAASTRRAKSAASKPPVVAAP